VLFLAANESAVRYLPSAITLKMHLVLGFVLQFASFPSLDGRAVLTFEKKQVRGCTLELPLDV